MSNPAPSAPAPRTPAVRMFGRYQLLRLLGKSDRSMAWAVGDPRGGPGLMLVLPRTQPVGSAALERWSQAVNRGARLNHPHLAAVVEVGVQDGWPFVVYESGEAATLSDKLSSKGLPALDLAAWVAQACSGLAFAHEGGVGHHDIQPFLLLVDDQGQVRLAGLETASETQAGQGRAAAGVEPGALRAQRDAAQRDVLALGVVLHHALVGQPALDEADVGKVMDRLPPQGRDIVRLPWTTPQPIPEPLRAIVNRATDRQERQRYRNARTLGRALEGWLKIEAGGASGPLSLLQDKLRAAGVLPSMPGAAQQAARMAMMERQRTNELADVVLMDMALAFELLRAVNTAQVRGAQVSGAGPVLTVRRAIAMLGLEGVRRAALALRAWPGPLNEAGAAELERVMARVRRAGHVAVALRPAGYDAEVVYLITLLQNLGRLVVQYHFADEASQIRRLMQPAPSGKPGEPDEPGMSEEGAAFAVLGVDVEAIGAAVARYWGLDDSVLAMVRRLGLTAPVHQPDDDNELLRLVASAGNEAADALNLPAHSVQAALLRVVQRYGRTLNFGIKDLQTALSEKPQSISAAPSAMSLHPEPEGEEAVAATDVPAPAAGGLRAQAHRVGR
ncbi:MAG: serine/threonine protein kinase [Rubrivivax sp.]